jgi:sigma-B regulation protein RsbU (phosphoserine phosphatase)
MNASVELVCWKVWGGNERADIELAIPGLEGILHANPHQSSEKGGDLYYMSACGSGAVARFCLADVSGHGETMAPVSEWFETAFSKQIHREKPSDVLSAVNERAVASSFQGFSTAICASYNSLNGNFQYCYAGHPYIRIRRNGSDQWQELESTVSNSTDMWNLPLGVSSVSKYSVGSTRLKPGDQLVLFTDGLYEAKNEHGVQIGNTIWGRLPPRSTAANLLDSILEQSQKFIGSETEIEDDLTIITFDVQPYQRGNKYSLLLRSHLWAKIRNLLRKPIVQKSGARSK